MDFSELGLPLGGKLKLNSTLTQFAIPNRLFFFPKKLGEEVGNLGKSEQVKQIDFDFETKRTPVFWFETGFFFFFFLLRLPFRSLFNGIASENLFSA